MKYKYCDAYRTADSIADLMAIYPTLQGESKTLDGGDTDSAFSDYHATRLRGEGAVQQIWKWEMAIAEYSMTIPRGHGWLKLSKGDEDAVENFLAAFPLETYPKAVFTNVPSSAGSEFVEYTFIIGINSMITPRQSAILHGDIVVVLNKYVQV